MDFDAEGDIVNVDAEHEESDYTDDLDEGWEEDNFLAGVVRVPPVLLQTIFAMMDGQCHRDRPAEMGLLSPRIWMGAIARKFPDTRLAILRSTDPCLLPPWLLRRGGFEPIQVRP